MASFQAPASAGARLDAARHAIALVINQEIAWRAHYIHTMLRNNESEESLRLKSAGQYLHFYRILYHVTTKYFLATSPWKTYKGLAIPPM